MAELVFCCEAVFQRCGDSFYSTSASFGMSLWERYLSVFDRITVVARVEEVTVHSDFLLDASRIQIIALPRYKGLAGTIKASLYLPAILKTCRKR